MENISAVQWVQLILTILTLISIVYGVFKVVNRNNEEWRDRERRLQMVEGEVVALRKDNSEVVRIGAQLELLHAELGRLRNRLDQFFDSLARENSISKDTE